MRAVVAPLRGDHLVRGSLFITLSSASMGVLGFAFWIVAARFYTPSQIGVATTIVSAAVLISTASLLGTNNTFLRYLPTSLHRDDEINTGLIVVFVGALLIGAGYMSIVPSFVGQLAFLRHNPAEAVVVVILTAFGAVNIATDSIFVAYRAAHYNVLVDGLVQGVIRLGLPVAFVGLGAFGLFACFGTASIGAVVASLMLLVRRFSYRPTLSFSTQVVKRVFRFGSANYLASLFNLAPTALVPLIVLHGSGTAVAAYFYLAMAVATLPFYASNAVGQALLAEGSRHGSGLGDLTRRSLRLLLVTVLPAGVAVAVTARWILLVFGSKYAVHASSALTVLGLSTPAVALNYWTSALLRIRHQLPALVWSNAALTAVITALAALWVHRGIAWVALAWLLGNLVSGLWGGAALVMRGNATQRVAPLSPSAAEVDPAQA